MRRMRPLAAVLALIASLVWLQPNLQAALVLREIAADPVRLAAHRLVTAATPERLDAEIRSALADDDPGLAASLVALADDRSVPVEPALRRAVEAANAPDPIAAVGSFLRGAVVGDEISVVGLSGAFAGDLVGIGDVRDLAREGHAYMTGGEPDRLVVGLSVVGLAITGATWGSAGVTAPARAGLTLVKTAARTGRLTATFAESLGRMAARAVDAPAVRRGLREAADMDPRAAAATLRTAVRPEAAGPLLAVARDAGSVASKAGVRALDDVLPLAADPADLARAAKLAEGYGDRTRAVVKLAGRGALIGLDLMLTLLGWIYAALAWGVGLAMAVAAGGRGLARMTRRRTPYRQRAKPADLELSRALPI